MTPVHELAELMSQINAENGFHGGVTKELLCVAERFMAAYVTDGRDGLLGLMAPMDQLDNLQKIRLVTCCNNAVARWKGELKR